MPSNSKDKRESVLKTVRLPESLARSLEREAAEDGTTVNADIISIISRHFDWHKKAREFGFVSIHKPLFTSLFEELDEKTLARIGREVMTASWKEMAEFWFQDSSPDGILNALSMKSKFEPMLRTRITKDEDTYTIVFHHDFGPKWSIVLKSALQEFVRKSFQVEPRITAGDSVITVRFKVNPRVSHA